MIQVERSGVDIRRLRYFVAVCDHGGLSKAAAVIGMAQPALTRQIKLLEQEIGLSLFTRNGRGAMPTEAGIFLLNETRKHLDGLNTLVDRLRQDFGEGPAKVSLGICPTIVPLFLDHISGALRHSPGTHDLSVIEAYSGDLRNLMDAGRLDLALTYSTENASGRHAIDLLSERLVLATMSAPDEETVSLDDLAGMKLIFPSRMHQLRRIIDAACRERRVELVPALELDSLATVKALVGDGTGEYATILPYHAVAADAQNGLYETRLIDDPGMIRTITLVQADDPAGRIPEGLAGHIVARAAEIKKTMAAVF
jgi:LysR family nitrogen assimilation transcriptional regulator